MCVGCCFFIVFVWWFDWGCVFDDFYFNCMIDCFGVWIVGNVDGYDFWFVDGCGFGGVCFV